MNTLLISLFIASFTTLFAIFLLRPFTINIGLLDRPNHRKIHEGSIPLIGGLAITVPPAGNTISGGHITNWNAGLLLYNLVLAGFDCRDASILNYGYNISLIVQKKAAFFPDLSYDSGDLRKINKCLPDLKFFPTENDDPFNGNIYKINW